MSTATYKHAIQLYALLTLRAPLQLTLRENPLEREQEEKKKIKPVLGRSQEGTCAIFILRADHTGLTFNPFTSAPAGGPGR